MTGVVETLASNSCPSHCLNLRNIFRQALKTAVILTSPKFTSTFPKLRRNEQKWRFWMYKDRCKDVRGDIDDFAMIALSRSMKLSLTARMKTKKTWSPVVEPVYSPRSPSVCLGNCKCNQSQYHSWLWYSPFFRPHFDKHNCGTKPGYTRPVTTWQPWFITADELLRFCSYM